MDAVKEELISKGAEAEVWRGSWRERDIVIKKRVKKGYRHPELDKSIRKRTIRKEARLMSEVKPLGVPVPIIYDVNEPETVLMMEYIQGVRVLDHINEGRTVDMERIGCYVGLMHEAGITHGDLTTSNILYVEEKDEIYFIDFSLGEKGSNVEDMGVDLHLILEALISVHPEPEEKFEALTKGYLKTFEEGEEAVERAKKIEARGRYH